MKKFICIILIAVAGFGAKAQEIGSASLKAFTAALAAKSLDTCTNTDTTYLYFTNAAATYDLHFVLTYTRISGTAGGGILMQGYDGTSPYSSSSSWDSLSNVVAGPTSTNYSDNPTFSSLSSGSSTKQFYYCGPTAYRHRYIRFRLITSGTQTGSFTGTAWYRKRD